MARPVAVVEATDLASCVALARRHIDLRTGAVRSGPARKGLRHYDVAVVAGTVLFTGTDG